MYGTVVQFVAIVRRTNNLTWGLYHSEGMVLSTFKSCSLWER